MTPAGFPHSEIPGSRLVCSSPGLIAAYHVFHRLLTPRHPPSALSNLIENLGARSRLASRRLEWIYPEGSIPEDSRRTDRDGSRSGFRLIRSCQRSLLAPDNSRRLERKILLSSCTGGDNRSRTGNLRLAKAALSQLSYIPSGERYPPKASGGTGQPSDTPKQWHCKAMPFPSGILDRISARALWA